MSANQQGPLMSIDELSEYAVDEARRQRVSGRISSKKVSRRIRMQLKTIKSVYLHAMSVLPSQNKIPQPLEWLMDNWYIAQREGLHAAAEIRHAGRLPAPRFGLPAVYALTRSLVRAQQGELSVERLDAFLESAQSVRALEECELWVLIPMLRAALVEQLFLCYPALESSINELSGKRKGGSSPNPQTDTKLLVSNVFGSLRMLLNTDLSELISKAGMVERILSRDPAGVYTQMDERSRAYYRHELSLLARRQKISESEAAKRVVAQAEKGADARTRHVGQYILNPEQGERMHKAVSTLYFPVMGAFCLIFALLPAAVLKAPAAALLLILPAAELSKTLCDLLAVRLHRVRHVPRLELPDGIPDEGATLCVICALLTDTRKGAQYATLLEHYRLLNRDAGKNLVFGLLADLPDADEKLRPGDSKCIEAAQRAIYRLNRKYGGGFYLFLRDRSLNLRDKRYMGWERKRGALSQLMQAMRAGGSGSLRVVTGDPAFLRTIRYLITLDADTRLCAGTARELTGAMLHPLNAPVLDPEKKLVRSGYGLLQPRISVELEAAGKSLFSRICAGHGGIDPYCSSVSDVYHDLFNEGTYTGKGIIDINAFLTCLIGRFPENTVLSHDLLEGAYLHAGLIGDVELTDGCPYKVIAWYDRLHRWVRGDWQAARWLSGRVKNGFGGSEKNPLSGVSRFKVLDNLRRSLTPAAVLAALLAGFMAPDTPLLYCAGFACACYLSDLLISSSQLLLRSRQNRGSRYHSSLVSGWKGAVSRVFVRLFLLPLHAYICLSAALTALYRMFVSKRNLLSWVTAAQAEHNAGAGIRYYCLRMWMVFPAAAAALSGGHPAGYLLAAVWLAAPVLSSLFSRDAGKAPEIPGKDRAFLMHEAALMWNYFETFMTRENHYLPPDNWQEQPATGQARRTSPTNIGLALLCILSACDLKLISPARAVELTGCVLDTLERLTKWNGHLLNWYDIATLRPLYPRYVSSVDSGNLAGCLMALRAGLYELKCPESEPLAARAHALCEAMRFDPLYDPKRRLFHIGYDLDSGSLTEGWYDLMASEARQTSYIAVARGEVERRHWSRLSRAMVLCDSYSGMVSWTGTMFEYLMPALLMPSYKNSFLSESMLFCIYCQKKHAFSRHQPWGISESAFYSFDPALNYQYAAHGVARLGLKRGLNRESVISPYSSFLALPLAPASAVKNLRRLRDMGMEGRYGFFEAVDFTPSRLVQGRRYEIIRCFMVHHLGMSLVAVNNALSDGVMVRRFMHDPRMAAFDELLKEKVPVDAVAVRHADAEVPEKPPRVQQEGWRQDSLFFDPWLPRCALIGNGSYTVLATDAGHSASSCAGLQLTRAQLDPLGELPGMLFFLKHENGLSSLTPLPLFERDMRHSCSLSGTQAKWSALGHGFELTQSLRVPANDNCELREITIINREKLARECELVCYFEPVLSAGADFEAHPAFSKLFIKTQLSKAGVLVRRRARGDGQDGYLAFVCSDESVGFETSRERFLGRGGLGNLARALSRGVEPTHGEVLDACVAARVKLHLAPLQRVTVRFALSYAQNGQDALSGAMRTLESENAPALSRLDASARLLGLTQADVTQAMDFVCALSFPLRREPLENGALSGPALGQSALWQFGISGDLPILLVRADGQDAETAVSRLIRQHRLLITNGYVCDLVLLLNDGADYRRPMHGAVFHTLKLIGCEYVLGTRGGVHPVDSRALTDGLDGLLRACADVYIDIKEERFPEFRRIRRLPAKPAAFHPADTRPVSAPLLHRLPDGAVCFELSGRLPRAAWSHVLANPSFGYLCTDTGTGHMWRLNSRENKMTPWLNDPLAVRGAEQLELSADRLTFSLFADDDSFPCRVTYGFGWAVWEKQVKGIRTRLTAFVPPTGPARVFLIEAEGVPAAKLSYACRLVMGSDQRAARHVRTAYDTENAVFSAQNPYNTDFHPQRFHLICAPAPEGFTCSASACARGLYDGFAGAASDACFAALLPLEPSGNGLRAVLVSGCSQNEPGLRLLMRFCSFDFSSDELARTRAYWQTRARPLVMKTPDAALDDYIGGWALYQTQACRLYARTSLYQCGGAYGFRDQLQDVCALMYSDPCAARTQLLRAAAHQFSEGDAQHWWHPHAPVGKTGHKGVRTRCSDDLMWLPYAVSRYVRVTGDRAVLDIRLPYLSSAVLSEEEHERYEVPGISESRESLLAHCLRACTLVLARKTDSRGLPLIGSGDWNDGMNLVGAQGKGSSVWLAWFFSISLRDTAALCLSLGKNDDARTLTAAAERFERAAGESWDGGWYRRAYYDDGTPLGSHENEECRIDSIAQSFAVLSGQADPVRSAAALDAAVAQLADRKNRLIRLFTPPFENTLRNPGYIKGYPPGIRENGGQYTHAAVWLAYACFYAGKANDAAALLGLLLPSGREHDVYLTEPYVLAADVYSNPACAGRGGWSWYTGAAGWYWRAAAEGLLGISVNADCLTVRPNLPDGWPGCEAVLTLGGCAYRLLIERTGTPGITCDATPCPGGVIPLSNREGGHEIHVTV